MISIGAWLCCDTTQKHIVLSMPKFFANRSVSWYSDSLTVSGSRIQVSFNVLMCSRPLENNNQKIEIISNDVNLQVFCAVYRLSSNFFGQNAVFKWPFLVRKARHPPVTRSFSRRPRLHFPVDLSSAQHHAQAPKITHTLPHPTDHSQLRLFSCRIGGSTSDILWHALSFDSGLL